MEDSPLDPVLGTLLAELLDSGLITGINLSNMARRLEEGGNPDLAEAVRLIALSCAIDSPEYRRAGIYSIDGGNEGP